MKTRNWILLISGILVVCLALSAFLWLPRTDAACVQVWSEGKLLHTLDLRVDRVLTVTTDRGINVITVRDGKVAVTEADCPDGYCVARGFCSSGVQIVCLPHRLELRFVGEQAVDAVTG